MAIILDRLKKYKPSVTTIIYSKILLVSTILILLNVISSKIFFRADLTENNIYTISASTKKILTNLDDVISVNVYFSKELPASFVNLKRQVTDIMEEYRICSNNKIKYQFIDPAEDPETTSKAQKIGIPEIQMNVIEKDKREVKMGYLGLALFYEDKTEVIPVIQNTVNLEYDLTSLILKITRKSNFTIAYLSGSGERNLSSEYRLLNEGLSKQYNIKEVSIAKGQRFPQNAMALIVAGPENTSEEEKYAIDQFIMQGKKAIFLIDTLRIENLNAATKNTNIAELLDNYGVKIKTNLVLDKSNTSVAFNSGFITFSIPYPLWPKLINSNFDKENPITSRLDSIVLPWASSLIDKKSPGISFTPLLSTTEKAWTQDKDFDLNPQQEFLYQNTGKHTIGAILKGRFHSFYKNRPDAKQLSPQTSIIVVGDSDFLLDDIARRFSGNLNFLMNAVDFIAIGDDLISIRAKNIKDKPLSDINNKIKVLIKFIATSTGTLIIMVVGYFRYNLRKKFKQRISSEQNSIS
ncbi:MAG: hypothetical protein DKM50_11835 [Candidatus Margulisiibacteriota bacterium]|nr:MAG: hypothetical protein A2X43_04740 [Candidatus Margulisbacteria bacterium GWD2_39_127]OGI01550.1 MAG: hypothetical protein A2X42_08210 [Candidatus Margulisbacteria bacterium GWF2_38_17]OGI09991.1 MAG: hypothetical protein A2X41_08920 [Candidatus Margulisbacteria bacterium GWE2_39_32]PZM78245.1 MAG: hypothetical protein DKM50_11835 [Candidatus Margulisiibacteriota bacterium]HAR61868.1 hypothetical protein [Candidatus Margulisiibacteriota bacterium]